MSKKVLIVMGSRSDLPAMEGCMKVSELQKEALMKKYSTE